MSRSHTKFLLNKIGVYPNKKLGQSFLCDQNISQWIVKNLNANKEDHVVEVGAGLGSLSRFLVGEVKHLTLIEKDKKLAKFLQEQFFIKSFDTNIFENKFDQGDVDVFHEDAMNFDLRKFYKYNSVKFIGNLPYSVTSDILRNFLEKPSPFNEAIIMLQREVCKRICAKENSKEISSLSLAIQVDWDVKLIKLVKPNVFFPKPEIISGVLHLKKKSPEKVQIHNRKLFKSLINKSFSQRRKQIKNLIGVDADKLKTYFDKLELKDTVRAEEISLNKWIELTNLVDEDYESNKLEFNSTKNELLQVVDKDDNKIGGEERHIIHQKNLLHRAVHIFVKNKSNEIYLQKRTYLKDMMPLKWDSSASGHVNVDESYKDAAIRELDEELGVKCNESDLKFICNIDACEENGWEFVSLYEIEHKSKMKINDFEIEFVLPFSVEFIKSWIDENSTNLANGFVKCFQEYVKSL